MLYEFTRLKLDRDEFENLVFMGYPHWWKEDKARHTFEAFKDGLKERGEPDDNITDTYENLDYALQHIKGYFGNRNETHINGKDAYIFAKFAHQEVKALKEIAREIDDRYTAGK